MISKFLLIIGAMKSGTTTLYDHLARHPQISTAPKKEIDFFSSEGHWARGLDWYEAQFDHDPRRHNYALDASTNYTKHPFYSEVAGHLKASAPRQFKLIYIMRHPLRRIESQALFSELNKSEAHLNFLPYKSYDFDAGISLEAIALSLYAYQIDKFSDYFDNGELLLLTLEQLAREPQAVLRKVYEFLKVDNVLLRETLLQSNTAASNYAPHPIWKTLQRIAPLRSVVRAVVPKERRRILYDSALVHPKGRFALNAREELAMSALLTPDLIRLRDRYNVDAEKEWGIVL